MRMRVSIASLLSITLAACAGGSAGAPSLGYAVPSPMDLTYVVGDTIMIALEGLGQDAEIGARSAATYALHYERGTNGVRVTAAVEDLAADVVLPMTSPLSMEEDALAGDFVFELDRRGRPGAMSSPHATQLGGQVFAAPVLAHALFPRLPGTPASSGDSWTDSVTYREEGEAGVTEVHSDLTYTVSGESEASGRSLVDVAFEGTATVTQDLTLEGARITQASELAVAGRLRWDAHAGVLYDSEMRMEGPGSVRVALLPGAALPTKVRWQTRIRLQTR